MSKPCKSIAGDWADYYESWAKNVRWRSRSARPSKRKEGGDTRIDWPFGLRKMPKGFESQVCGLTLPKVWKMRSLTVERRAKGFAVGRKPTRSRKSAI